MNRLTTAVLPLVLFCLSACEVEPAEVLVAPEISSTLPASAAVLVPPASVVVANFSQVMDPDTINATTFTLKRGTSNVSATVTLDAAMDTATLTPGDPLEPGSAYTARVSAAASNARGVALGADYTWSFTAVAAAVVSIDSPPPITSTTPLPHAPPTNATPSPHAPPMVSDTVLAPSIVMATPRLDAPYISVNDKVRATFSVDMAPGSFSELTFLLLQGSTPISGEVTFDEPNNIAVFTPAGGLEPALPYTATLTTEVTDLSGTPLAANFSWSFTTSCSELVVGLGNAANFAVLGGTSITNAGPTVIVGNVGVSPGSTVTGFPPATIIDGTLHVGTPPAPPAVLGQAALTIAYDDAAGRVSLCSTDVSALDLGGQTLKPGLYKDAGAMELSGELTLDALGDPDAIFLFQAFSTLTTTGNSQVTLINGAKAKNVFWQVGSSATLGTNSSIVGTVMALTSVTVTAGATVVGRVLAGGATVTMDTNDITLPASVP